MQSTFLRLYLTIVFFPIIVNASEQKLQNNIESFNMINNNQLFIFIGILIIISILMMILFNKNKKEFQKKLDIKTKEFQLLKANLAAKLEFKINELNDEKILLNSVINSQENFVLTTSGNLLKSANKSFFDFYQVSSIDDFRKNYGDCISSTFSTTDEEKYIQQNMGNESWSEYIYNRPDKIHKVLIKSNEVSHIFSVTTDRVEFQGEEYITSVFTDITQNELIQNTLEESEKYSRMIFEESSRPIVIYDTNTDGFIDCNDAAVKAYGYSSREEVLGKTPLDVSAPYQYDGTDSLTASQQQDMSALQKGAVSFEWLHQKPNGELWDANVHLMQFNYKNKVLLQFTLDDITVQNKTKKTIEENHQKISDSIKYAALIQHSLIPEEDKFALFFNDYFSIWNPKDTVGGDIYLIEKIRDKDECIIMVIDCTGHGVPGAFVTILVKAIERQIISQINNNINEEVSPAKILSVFNKNIKSLLKQERTDCISNAGFDGGIIYYNKKDKILKFSGAETPLFYVRQGEITTIKGSRQSVGYKKSDIDFEFEEHIIEVEDGMEFYLTTDGYIDQNGGKKDFPFGKTEFKKIISQENGKAFKLQKKSFLDKLKKYQGEEERNDDITVIGFKI